MKVTRFIDRKLLLLVVGPVIRHLSNGLSLYLAGQGLNAGLINQVEAAVIAGATLAVNVMFELRDQNKVASKAVVAALDMPTDVYREGPLQIVPDPWRNVPVDYDVRDRFERESG